MVINGLADGNSAQVLCLPMREMQKGWSGGRDAFSGWGEKGKYNAFPLLPSMTHSLFSLAIFYSPSLSPITSGIDWTMPLPANLRLNAFKYPIAFIRLIELVILTAFLVLLHFLNYRYLLLLHYHRLMDGSIASTSIVPQPLLMTLRHWRGVLLLTLSGISKSLISL